MLSKNDISLRKKDISLSRDDISLSGNDILQYVNDISLTGSDISPKNKTIAVTIYRSIYRLRLISVKYRRYVAIFATFVDYRLHYFCTILYVEALEQKETLKCKGKKLNQVGAKQVGRKLLHLQNKAQCALWFCKSYGLELISIEFQDQDGGSHTIDYCESITRGSYDKLSQDEKNKIEQVLFLMDKFCVGDEVYHELSMITE